MSFAVQPHWVLEKTPKGREEVGSRSHRLMPLLRGLLILTDGRRTAAELLRTSPDAARTQEGLSLLLQDGFVQAATPGQNLRPGPIHPKSQGDERRARLRALVQEMFGPQEKLLQKFDASCDELEGAQQTIQASGKYIKLFISAARADVFCRRANALLELEPPPEE